MARTGLGNGGWKQNRVQSKSARGRHQGGDESTGKKVLLYAGRLASVNGRAGPLVIPLAPIRVPLAPPVLCCLAIGDPFVVGAPSSESNGIANAGPPKAVSSGRGVRARHVCVAT